MAMPYEIGGTSIAQMDFDHEDSISASSKQSNTPKKVRRRSSRMYRCPVENCGKAYSRAEHLSRHQLNHDPKEIYRCDVPNCSRSFVRLDLYSLHRTRHMGEYIQQQNDCSPSHSSSAQTPEFMDFSTESTLNQGNQSQLLPHYHRSTAQIGYSDQEPQQSQQSPAEAGSTFGMTEISGQTPLPPRQSNQMEILSQQQQHLPDISMWRNEVQPPTSIPLFGGESYTPPFTITDDFIQYLFNGSTPSQLSNTDGTSPNSVSSYINSQGTLYGSMNRDIFSEGYLPQVPFTIDVNSSQTKFSSMALSYEKSQEIFELVQNKFTGNTHPHSINGQSTLLDGDRSQDSNIMSRKRMQDHIDSYWENFHSQLPILHRPSFSPNKTPNLLLIAIMIIGASCSIQPDNHVMTKSTREFSEVLAWYLRWEIFGSMHIQSDTLWVFQTLLLLETYEKTYSSRTLHERAHIHHATAITLMRRGGFLVGRSPLDSPPDGEEDASGSYRMARPTKDVYWDEWIRRESTRRVALAAFMIDSLHAAMFGHSIVMVTHEMRLVLPCDDTLWSATSVDEVRKIEMTLRSNGVKPLSFLEGLQKTLNGQEIYTNPFGRSILLCGLLSVSWHMNQRDLQINSLDVSSQGGVRGSKWRRSITRAFNLWRSAYEQMSSNISDDTDVLHGSRFALYHLAQFSVNVDIVECQVFAGASRVLGRSMGRKDVETARRRIRNTWAKSVEARRAAFYALRFLCLVLNKPNSDQVIDCEYIHKYATSNNTLPMHRWVLYSAALIVWCYSYAVDGPMHSNSSSAAGNSIEDHIRDMSAFLERAENIKSPEDVAFHRLNGCTGMLKVLRYIFRMGTWELLHEGADLLTNCIKLMETVG